MLGKVHKVKGTVPPTHTCLKGSVTELCRKDTGLRVHYSLQMVWAAKRSPHGPIWTTLDPYLVPGVLDGPWNRPSSHFIRPAERYIMDKWAVHRRSGRFPVNCR